MKIYYDAFDISEMLGISKSGAYNLIKELNQELAQEGYLVISGKVPTAYFAKRWFGLEKTQQEMQGAL